MKNRKMLRWTILIIAMFQMPALAVSPAISGIIAHFGLDPNLDLERVQTALQFPNLISPFVSILASIIIAKAGGRIAKKSVIITGLACILITATGITLFNGEFWMLYLWGAFTGISVGLFIPTTASLMMDSFEREEVRMITGQQTSFINIGSIIMSILGGLLADLVWFGGYLTFYFAVPIIIMCLIYLPGKKLAEAAAAEKYSAEGTDKGKFNPNVAFYGVIIFFFMMTYSVCGSNLSSYVIDQLHIGKASIVGYITAVQMLGGMCSGLLFGKLSAKLKDYMIPLGFLMLLVGFSILACARFAAPADASGSAFPALAVIFVGAFISGSSISMVMPQCNFSISLYVNSKTSTFANAISSSIAPSLGGFLSPKVFTNLTSALFGASISSRYFFLAAFAAVVSLLLVVIMTLRKKGGKAKGWD